ncbi:MAG: hypothetical protein Q8M11_09040 [Sulfuritalea sp.]|nr:hypothetical protein [Sulfuritalea sp.]MDP1984473.1 hypothetical protein [Sulfuritalea sp.]
MRIEGFAPCLIYFVSSGTDPEWSVMHVKVGARGTAREAHAAFPPFACRFARFVVPVEKWCRY